MNKFAKRYEEDNTSYSEYDQARAAMANIVRSYPTNSYSFRTVGNTDSFEQEYQSFINKLNGKNEEKVEEAAPVVEETPVVEEAPVVETPAPKKRKSKVTVEETVATDESLFG